MRTMFGNRRLWLWFAMCFVVGLMGCSGTKPILLRDLERTPSDYAGRIVTVQGCYHNGPETTLLQPCTDPRPDEVVWVVPRRQLEDAAKAVPGYSAGAVKYERPSAKEDQLAQQLAGLPNGAFAEVELRGEFRSSPRREYGIAPGYKHEFVLHRVLSVSQRTSSH